MHRPPHSLTDIPPLSTYHRFAYLARKGIQTLQGKIKNMAFECAFTVEGRTDEELPEVRIYTGRGSLCVVFWGRIWVAALTYDANNNRC